MSTDKKTPLPVRDPSIPPSEVEVIQTGLEGVTALRMPVHHDSRGHLVEAFNPAWTWGGTMAYAHVTAIEPRSAKGWALHEESEDHYFPIRGEATVVLFDGRESSSTYHELVEVVLSVEDPMVLHIPTHVWHAIANQGDAEAAFMNFPSQLYRYENPDKYRLPLKNDLINYDFRGLDGF